ncbi:MAG: NTP transferase domain-containing protein [Deltaproteobacteria bacterium]|nr:NTP transferase domain-containing protein [Deltaproteobacteria bacterium]
MNAAILAAGLGTRLRPLTHQRPKALLPVLNQPLLGVLLRQLQAAGFTRVAVNTHHLAATVQEYLASRDWGLEVVISHEPEILGTGGGLRGLGERLGPEPFLAINADTLTDLNLAAVFQMHQEDNLATLVLHWRRPYNSVWIDETGRVVSVGEPPDRPFRPPLAYTGVQMVSPGMLARLGTRGYADLVEAWREALAAGEIIGSILATGHFWQDLGTPAAYLETHRRLLAGEAPRLAPFLPPVADPFLGQGALLEDGAVCEGGVCLGQEVRVGAGARLKNTVVWEQARISPRVVLEDCIVGAGVEVRTSARGELLV